MEAHVNVNSQTFRLRERATDANIRHGQEVRADVPHVRVGAVARFSGWQDPTPEQDQPTIFFCHMGPIRVREILTSGDEAALPETAVVDGVNVSTPGYYDLVNVLVRTNGDIRLVVDRETTIVPVGVWPSDEMWR
jgi:hypothetical protein